MNNLQMITSAKASTQLMRFDWQLAQPDRSLRRPTSGIIFRPTHRGAFT